MQKWEYRVLSRGWSEESKDIIWFDTHQRAVEVAVVSQRLNDLGKEGWELVDLETITSEPAYVTNYYLRRLIH